MACAIGCLVVGGVFASRGMDHVTPAEAAVALKDAPLTIAPAETATTLAFTDKKSSAKIDLSSIALDLPVANDPKPSAAPKIATSDHAPKKDLAKDVTKDLRDAILTPPTKDKQRLMDARAEAETHPEDAHALQAWANAAFKAGDYREARHATEAWSLRDGSPEPRIFLAEVLDATGKRADARAVLEEVLDLHPDSTEARRLHAHYGAPLPSLDSAGRKSIAHR